MKLLKRKSQRNYQVKWIIALVAICQIAGSAHAQANGVYFDAEGDAVAGGFAQATHRVDILKYETHFDELEWVWKVNLKDDIALGLGSQHRPVTITGLIGFGSGIAPASTIDELRSYIGASPVNLGESFLIDIGTESDEPGFAKIYEGGSPDPIGTAQLEFRANRLLVRVRRDTTPFSGLLSEITSSMVVGDLDGVSDAAPEFTVAVAAPVPEPASMCALGIGTLCLWRGLSKRK